MKSGEAVVGAVLRVKSQRGKSHNSWGSSDARPMADVEEGCSRWWARANNPRVGTLVKVVSKRTEPSTGKASTLVEVIETPGGNRIGTKLRYLDHTNLELYTAAPPDTRFPRDRRAEIVRTNLNVKTKQLEDLNDQCAALANEIQDLEIELEVLEKYVDDEAALAATIFDVIRKPEASVEDLAAALRKHSKTNLL